MTTTLECWQYVISWQTDKHKLWKLFANSSHIAPRYVVRGPCGFWKKKKIITFKYFAATMNKINVMITRARRWNHHLKFIYSHWSQLTNFRSTVGRKLVQKFLQYLLVCIKLKITKHGIHKDLQGNNVCVRTKTSVLNPYPTNVENRVSS